MKPDTILINGVRVHSGNLTEFTRDWTGDLDIPQFLAHWYAGQDTFPAFTSGSTGSPSRIELNKVFAVASARATNQFLGLKPGQTALLSMPAKYIAGKMMMVRAITGHLNLIPIQPASSPQLPRQSIDLAAFTPHQFRNLIRSVDVLHQLDLGNVLLGGAPFPNDLANEVDGFRGRIYETFGMTETYSHVALRQRWPAEEAWFQAMPGVHFQTEHDKLIIRAPHIGIDRLETNDIVRLQGHDQFQWLGRADFVINSGGIKLHPEIMEQKLTGQIQNPFFITGQADAEFGEIVILVIQKHPEIISEYELRQILEQNLDRYENPKAIVWVDTMIYTPTGKINRRGTIDFYQI